MIHRALPALGGLLVLFHAWLFGSQLWDGRLADPGFIARWAIAGGLVAAAAALQRSGASLLWGRKAIALWLLAALLHGPAMTRESGNDAPALPEAMATILQIAAASAVAGLGLALLAAIASGPAARPAGRSVPIAVGARVVATPDHPPRFAPRPPPAHAALARS